MILFSHYFIYYLYQIVDLYSIMIIITSLILSYNNFFIITLSMIGMLSISIMNIKLCYLSASYQLLCHISYLYEIHSSLNESMYIDPLYSQTTRSITMLYYGMILSHYQPTHLSYLMIDNLKISMPTLPHILASYFMVY
jgi:hypothetical protein